MRLIWKLNLVLLGIFLVGLAISSYVSYNVLQKNAREEVAAARAPDDGGGAGFPHLHQHAGQDEYGEVEEIAFIAMEYVNGMGDRRAFLREMGRDDE